MDSILFRLAGDMVIFANTIIVRVSKARCDHVDALTKNDGYYMSGRLE